MQLSITAYQRHIEKKDGSLFLNGHKSVRAIKAASEPFESVTHYVYQISGMTFVIDVDLCNEAL